MLNHIDLMGRLSRDPELRYTASQVPVASFAIAVERDYAAGGERQTDFIDIVAWRHTANFISRNFSKGDMIVISGRLQIREWNDQDGNKRRNAEVVAESAYFGGRKRNDKSPRPPAADNATYPPPSNYYAPESYSSPSNYSFSDLSDADGELPF